MSVLLLPIKIVGLVAAGAALGMGWKLGSYIFKTVAADENVTKFTEDFKSKYCSWMGQEESEPLWKRRFDKF
jgi:hypothetical protein